MFIYISLVVFVWLIIQVFWNRPNLGQPRRINLCSTVFWICFFSKTNFCQISAMIIESKTWSYCLLPSLYPPHPSVLLSGLGPLSPHILPLLFQRSENILRLMKKNCFAQQISQSQGNYKIQNYFRTNLNQYIIQNVFCSKKPSLNNIAMWQMNIIGSYSEYYPGFTTHLCLQYGYCMYFLSLVREIEILMLD